MKQHTPACVNASLHASKSGGNRRLGNSDGPMSDFIRIWKSVKNSLDHAWRAIAVTTGPGAMASYTDGVGIPAHWRDVMATEQHCNWCYHTANCPVKKLALC